MRLQDAVIAASPFRVQTTDAVIHHLPGAADFATQIETAPVRYNLADDCAAMVTNTAYNESNLVDASLDLLRFPSTSFWIEWLEEGRLLAMKSLGLAAREGAPFAPRVGAYVKTDESGRRGEIFVFWDDQQQGEATMSPVIIEFDLDDPDFCLGASGDKLARKIELSGTDVLSGLFRRARYTFFDGWRDYYMRYSKSVDCLNRDLRSTVHSVANEFPFIAAFSLLLSAQGALRYEAGSVDRLNKARLKKGKRALLDYVTVSLDLGAPQGQEKHALNGSRTSPRLHHVCGHLVRRNDRLFWRRAHMRGSPDRGAIATRTVNVKATCA